MQIIFLFLVSVILCLVSGTTTADTIYMNDGRELKGIVVEDYSDRVTLSTVDGEVTVMKHDIRELYYDSEEDNLIKLAEQARQRHDFTKAFAYYDMALKINPDSKAAKDGLVFLQGYLFRQEQAKKEEEVKRQEEFEHHGSAVITEQSDEEKTKEAVEKLKRDVGISLAMKGQLPEIEEVRINSPAYNAGVRRGDLLVAIWGKLTGYMQLTEVTNVLLDKPSLELKCTIERTIKADVDGASFAMELEGLTVSDVEAGSSAFQGGLIKGDFIVAIDGKSTRYTPLKKALELMKGPKGQGVNLTLRREILIWRKG